MGGSWTTATAALLALSAAISSMLPWISTRSTGCWRIVMLSPNMALTSFILLAFVVTKLSSILSLSLWLLNGEGERGNGRWAIGEGSLWRVEEEDQ